MKISYIEITPSLFCYVRNSYAYFCIGLAKTYLGDIYAKQPVTAFEEVFTNILSMYLLNYTTF